MSISPDELERTIDNPDFIPGIYNYCDRWCERCSMTSRCATYAIEQLQDASEDSDENGEDTMIEALGKLDELFQLTIRMIHQTAEEMGLDLNETTVSESDETEPPEGNTDSEFLLPEAKEYADAASKWFDHASEEDIWPFLQKAWQKSIELNLPGESPLAEAEQTQDAFEVINWYQFQIQVKLQRAIRSQQRAEGRDDYDFEQSDADGSAKVALIGLDKSIEA